GALRPPVRIAVARDADPARDLAARARGRAHRRRNLLVAGRRRGRHARGVHRVTRVARALVNLPERTRANELVRVRALIAHPMETGYRPGADGRALPRDILRRFTCL